MSRCCESFPFPTRGIFVIAVVAAFICGANSAVLACNIPVFRYALERWSSDELQLHVTVRDSQLRDSDRQTIDRLTKSDDSPANFATTVWDLDGDVELPAFLADLALTEKDQPWFVIRSTAGAEPPRVVWSSPLREVSTELIATSPARETLSKMLLQGDSAVWMVVRGDDDRADATVELLRKTLRQLEDETQLPDGIGLPGSELYSEIPLMVSFPVLEMDPDDPAERVFLQHIREFLPGSQKEKLERQPTLVVPVFGRGRALVAMTADDVDASTVRDLTTFLCGACSCQVKRMNPGFDLLLNVDWKQQLFGDNATDIPADTLLTGEEQDIPTLVAIAPGNVADDPIPPLVVVPGDDEPETPASESSEVPAPADMPRVVERSGSTGKFVWLVGGFAGLIVLTTILSSVSRRA